LNITPDIDRRIYIAPHNFNYKVELSHVKGVKEIFIAPQHDKGASWL